MPQENASDCKDHAPSEVEDWEYELAGMVASQAKGSLHGQEQLLDLLTLCLLCLCVYTAGKNELVVHVGKETKTDE